MNIKKVGLTALAASLVSVSAHAGALSVSGAASMNMEGYSGETLNAGTTFSIFGRTYRNDRKSRKPGCASCLSVN